MALERGKSHLLQTEQRRLVGALEQIDYAPEQAAALREKIDVAAPLELHWQWDYAGEIEELRNLYDKGKTSQWNAETDLDWSVPFTPGEFVLKPEESLMASLLGMMGKDQKEQAMGQRDELAWTLSQLLHGEQAALTLCAQLVNICPDINQKFYAGSQVIDEVRHCETFAKLLQRKLGKVYPVDANLKFLFDTLLTTNDWRKKTLGMQLLFESVAVGGFDQLRQASLNPLLSDALYRVTQDESRHAAFGVLSMRRLLPALTQEEHDEMEDYAYRILECFHRGQLLGQLRDLLPGYGLDPENMAMMMLAEPTFQQKSNEIFNHMMPNLKNLGLITDRTRAGYAELGLS